jgi:hypothetical protein
MLKVCTTLPGLPMNKSKAGPTPCRSLATTMLAMVKVQLAQSSSLPRFQRRSSTGRAPGRPVIVMFLQASKQQETASKQAAARALLVENGVVAGLMLAGHHAGL